MRTLFFLILILFSGPGISGRPLITDDAGVVKAGHEQIETWIYGDERSGQHWVVPTFSLSANTELAVSFVHGLSFLPRSERNQYTFAGPILQAKIKLREITAHETGIAFAAGTIPPLGNGTFAAPSWEHYFYFAGSSDLYDNQKLLLYLNLGAQTRKQLHDNRLEPLWGVALEYETSSKTHAFIEATNGEVYALIPGIAGQIGFRYDKTRDLQLDGTIGRGFDGDPMLPVWVTLGFKYTADLI